MLTNWLVTLRLTPKTSVGIPTVERKGNQGIPPLKRRNGSGLAESETEQAEEFNGQFTDVFSKTSESEVHLLEKLAPPMSGIHVSNEIVIKLMKGLGPDEVHPRDLKERAIERCPVFAHLFQQPLDKGKIRKKLSLANICLLYKKDDRALPSSSVLDMCSLQDARTYSMYKYYG